MDDEAAVPYAEQRQKSGVKHLVPCRCILPQFRNRVEPVFHRIVVFSVIDEDDNVLAKNVQCNNCGALHKVTEIGQSEILVGSEDSRSVRTIDDIAIGMPERLAALLRSYNAPIASWEECEFVINESRWDATVVLTRESTQGIMRGKAVRIKSADRFQIEQFETKLEF